MYTKYAEKENNIRYENNRKTNGTIVMAMQIQIASTCRLSILTFTYYHVFLNSNESQLYWKT